MKEHVAATLLAMTAACGCEHHEPAASNDPIPIACVLSALSEDQRAREAVLLKEHLASVREVEERDDGYAFRYAPDLALFARMAELVGLEHRCCPFLDFELAWPGGTGDPWLHVAAARG